MFFLMSPLLLLKIVVPETKILAPASMTIFEFSKLTMQQKDYSIEDIQFFIDRGFKLYDMYGVELNCKDLETKIFQLDEDHETCGNYILSKKKLNFSL